MDMPLIPTLFYGPSVFILIGFSKKRNQLSSTNRIAENSQYN